MRHTLQMMEYKASKNHGEILKFGNIRGFFVEKN